MSLRERVFRILEAHGRKPSDDASDEALETALSTLTEDRYDEGFQDGERDKDTEWKPTLPLTAA